MVLNGFPLINPTDALGAYTSPVAYLSKEDFKSEFCTLLDSFEANRQILNSLHEEDLIGHLFHAFRMAILCTKHPGFAEEREWRVIYTPSFTESPKIKQSIESVGGTPQRVYKIPLKNFPEENLVGIELPEFLDSVIVGPSQYPWEIKEAFSILLSNKGVTNTHDKIIVSDIPLRS